MRAIPYKHSRILSMNILNSTRMSPLSLEKIYWLTIFDMQKYNPGGIANGFHILKKFALAGKGNKTSGSMIKFSQVYPLQKYVFFYM